MSFADWLAGRKPHADRLPDRIEELRGPSRGVVVLPRHLAMPGMREFDVTDDPARRSMYGIVLTQGQRNDVARYLHPGLLREDWPDICDGLDPKLRGACEDRFALGAAQAGPDGQADEPGPLESPLESLLDGAPDPGLPDPELPGPGLPGPELPGAGPGEHGPPDDPSAPGE